MPNSKIWKIALVEDDRNILTSVSIALESEGFLVDSYTVGYDALRGLSQNPADLGIFDIKMPRMDGMELLQNLRRTSEVPIIFLTSKISLDEKILGLELGADDYITKPFSMRELLLRIKAILKRNPSEDSDKVISYENVELFLNKREVLIDKKSLYLTKTEFDFLECLMKNFDQVLSRDQLLEYSKFDYLESDDRVVDVHIKNLRKKLENLKSKLKIITVRSMGYRSTIG